MNEGVVDLRRLVVEADTVTLADFMSSPVVMVSSDDVLNDVVELFVRYHFRMLPVVDPDDHIVGVVHYEDIMKGVAARE